MGFRSFPAHRALGPLLAALVALLIGAMIAAIVSVAQGHNGAVRPPRTTPVARASVHPATRTAAGTTAPATPAATPASHAAPAAHHAAQAHTRIGTMTIRVTDPRRTVLTSHGRVRRSFTVLVRYPIGPKGPFALIVFGHGYAVTPTPYAPLLDDWTRTGYVVAAPVFPLENADAPGGPNERDLPNQPADMSLVITRMLSSRFASLVDRRRIAVAGQSDGGDTALAAAFDPRVRDRRIDAAVILSGAEDPFISGFSIPARHVPLLATQGTDDTINPPWMTNQFYDPASAPKYLLKLIGSGHLPPYTEPGPALTAVSHASEAFLNCYLKGRCTHFDKYRRLGTAGGPTVLSGEP